MTGLLPHPVRLRRRLGVALVATAVALLALAVASPAAAAQPDTAVASPTQPVSASVDPPDQGSNDAKAGGEAEVAGEPAREQLVAEDDTAAGAVQAAAIGPPAVNVAPTSGLNPAGGSTLAVSGTGFDPAANNGFGVYAVFGPVDAGTYFSDANRFLAAVWLHPGGGASGSPGQGELNPDGSFAATLPPSGGLPLTAQYTDGNGAGVNCLTTQCYVVTMAAHGVADRSLDTCTPVSFAGGSAVPQVDRACQPIPPGTQPTGTSGSGAPSGANGTTGSNGSSTGATTSAASTLPKTGTWAGPAVGLALALLLGGLTLIRLDRRRRKSALLLVVSQLDRSG